MKKAPQPKEDAPRTEMVVAVPSLTPEFALYNSATGSLQKVYGGNTCEQSVYLDGIMPKVFRMAAEDGSYEHELILEPLPNTIEELVLAENPECRLVITNAKVMQIAVAETAQAECTIIETPYAKAVRLKEEAEAYAKKAKKARAAGCIPLQLELNYQPQNRTA